MKIQTIRAFLDELKEDLPTADEDFLWKINGTMECLTNALDAAERLRLLGNSNDPEDAPALSNDPEDASALSDDPENHPEDAPALSEDIGGASSVVAVDVNVFVSLLVVLLGLVD